MLPWYVTVIPRNQVLRWQDWWLLWVHTSLWTELLRRTYTGQWSYCQWSFQLCNGHQSGPHPQQGKRYITFAPVRIKQPSADSTHCKGVRNVFSHNPPQCNATPFSASLPVCRWNKIQKEERELFPLILTRRLRQKCIINLKLCNNQTSHRAWLLFLP